MASERNESMRQLVQVVNRLQDALLRSDATLTLALPQICVVGGQSVGKSSVLESIVGKEFLPRGSGIVTRCPLILQCKQSDEEFVRFLHLPDDKFTDFKNDVRREIENQMDSMCGRKKGIVDKPISLTIHSPNVLDLTLVDLPGITRVAVGDQPPDIDRQTEEMVLKYAGRANVIILAVSAANADLANSDAMKVVKQVDPTGKRTIGVLTMLDIMNEGTHAREVLCNRVFPLQLGYVGVVNRNQVEIDQKVSIGDIRKKEYRFFSEHSNYSDIARKMGIDYLQRALNEELTSYIAKTLPELLSGLKRKKQTAEDELARLQLDVKSDVVLDRCLDDFKTEIQTEIMGNSMHVQSDKLSGGARIKSLFYEEFVESLKLAQYLNDNEDDFNKEINIIIQNLRALHHGVFVPDMAFHAVTTTIIKRYREPVQTCVQKAARQLSVIVNDATDVMKDYPALRKTVLFLMNTHIQRQTDITKDHLIVHVNAECSFKNMKHEDFLGHVTKQSLPALDPRAAIDQAVTPASTTNSGASGVERSKALPAGPTPSKKGAGKRSKELDSNAGPAKQRKTDTDDTDNQIPIILENGPLAETSGARQTGRRSRLTKIAPSDGEIATVKQLVKSYLTVVAKTITDIVPKYIVYLLIENTERYATRELSSRLRTQYDPKSLMERDPEIQNRIERLHEECVTTNNALNIIGEFYETRHSDY